MGRRPLVGQSRDMRGEPLVVNVVGIEVAADPFLELSVAFVRGMLSGMKPSSGTDKISSTSSMASISPRAARTESKRVISRCFSMHSPFSTFTVLESSSH
jgi:hypothetical protein